MKYVMKPALAALLFAATCVNAADSFRTQTVAALDAAAKGHTSSSIAAEITDLPAGRTLDIGKPLEVKLTVKKPAFVTLLYVDSHGVLEVFQPSLGSSGNSAATGESYVPGTANEAWQVRPPAGPATLYVVATEKPLPAFASRPEAERHRLVAAADSAPLANQIGRDIKALPADRASVQKLDVTVRLGSAQYAANDIVRYFTETTRSIKNPRLDIYINFAFNSADILPSSRPALDTWGRVLNDPLLSKDAFVIGGHTDDVGTEAYNADLSSRRARAVQDYLVAKYGIPSERLKVRGYGMTQPLVDGEDDAARAQNRRVDFERADEARP